MNRDQQAHMRLTSRQARFVEEYLLDLNGTQAAIRAGYSPKGATVQAARLIANAKVRAAIKRGMEARSQRTQIKADEVLREYARIRLSDIRTLFDANGRLIDLPDLPSNTAAFVRKFRVKNLPPTEEGAPSSQMVEVELWDKMAALAKLADHVGLTARDADSRDSLADALRTHARALPVATARAIPVKTCEGCTKAENSGDDEQEIQP